MASKTRSRDTSLRWQRFLAACFSWLTSIATVAALSAVGWYGHHTHWTFGLAGHDDHHHGPAAGEASHETAAATSHDRGHDLVEFDSPEAVSRAGIEVVPVEERPLVNELAVNGVVTYDERRIAQLSTRVTGSVWRVEKHLGDEVRKGDVLVIVESSDVGRLKAEFLNALVAFEAKREQLSILEEVQGAVMGRQIREARSALREATNHLTNAEQALVNLGFEISATEFAELDDAQRASKIRTLGLSPGTIAGIDPDRVTSNLIPLRAPFDGIVIGREAVVGENVEAGSQIFEVADVSRMWVVLSVSKEDAARVSIGQPVRFRPDGSDHECESVISWISTEVNDETRTLEVRAEVAVSSDLPVRANTFGSGRIEVERLGMAVVVPSQCVQWDGARWVVFEPRGDAAFTALAVSPGLREGDSIEIKGDFAAGTPKLVVGEGSHLLKSKILLDRMERGEM